MSAPAASTNALALEIVGGERHGREPGRPMALEDAPTASPLRVQPVIHLDHDDVVRGDFEHVSGVSA